MGAGRFCQTKIQKGLLYFTPPLCLALGISWVNYIAVRSFACLPSCWLTRVLFSLSLSISSFFLSLSQSLGLGPIYLRISTLGQRWTLNNRKHRFSLWLYRTRQGKGKSREILLTYFLIFFSIWFCKVLRDILSFLSSFRILFIIKKR